MKEYVKSKYRDVKDFPKKGIIFKDITTVLKDKKAFKSVVDFFEDKYKNADIAYVVGIESRGFILGAVLADRLNCGFIPVRKPGKLPAKTISETYELEYGTDSLEIHEDAIESGANVVIIDDLLATGGTANAAYNLIKRLNGTVKGMAFVLELGFLNGRAKLPQNVEITSMIVD